MLLCTEAWYGRRPLPPAPHHSGGVLKQIRVSLYLISEKVYQGSSIAHCLPSVWRCDATPPPTLAGQCGCVSKETYYQLLCSSEALR